MFGVPTDLSGNLVDSPVVTWFTKNMTTNHTSPEPQQGQRYGRKAQGACKNCGIVLWGDMDLPKHLEGRCILSQDEATQAIIDLLTSNYEAGLIDEMTYKAAMGGLKK